MNKSNRVKLVIAALLIVVVAIATISYGNSQRKKVAENDPTKSSLPTIEESQKQSNNPSKPGESQPAPKPSTQQNTPSGGQVTTPQQQTVQPQLPQGRTPATGPEDHILPVIILGSLTGLYIASRKHLKLLSNF